MPEHVQGTEGVKFLGNLALLTGHFGRPGTGVNPSRGQNNVQGSAHMDCEPDNLTGFVSLEQGRDAFESVWHVAQEDARRLGLNDGDQVRVRSRHGEARMPVKLDSRVKLGELFATFHVAEVFLNNLTSPH